MAANTGFLKLSIRDAAQNKILDVRVPFEDNQFTIHMAAMDCDGQETKKEIPVTIRDYKATALTIREDHISHTELGKQVSRRIRDPSPTANVFCAPLWKTLIGTHIETHYPCYSRSLWQVFIINYQVLTKTMDETIALLRSTQHAKESIQFVRHNWHALQSAFAEDPVLWLVTLHPAVFSSYMFFLSKYYEAKHVTHEIALQFIRNTVVFLDIHQRKISAKIFSATAVQDCKCQTCCNIRTLPDIDIPAETDMDPDQLPPTYNMDVFGRPVQREDMNSNITRALNGLGLLSMLQGR